eukprot:9428373-Ditylum_brightwellii.AAC.1
MVQKRKSFRQQKKKPEDVSSTITEFMVKNIHLVELEGISTKVFMRKISKSVSGDILRSVLSHQLFSFSSNFIHQALIKDGVITETFFPSLEKEMSETRGNKDSTKQAKKLTRNLCMISVFFHAMT